MANAKEYIRRKANAISLILTALYLLVSIIYGISTTFSNNDHVYYWLVNCFLGTVFIYFLFYFIIFNKGKTDTYDFEIQTLDDLSYTDFQQVFSFTTQDYDLYLEMFSQLVRNEEYTFYAKLGENNNVIIIAKNKDNKEVLNISINYEKK